MKIDPEHNVVYTVSLDKMMRIWDLRKGACLDTLYDPQPQ